LRPGHNSPGGLQECLETNSQIHTVLEAIEQRQLIDEDGSQYKPLRVDQAFGRHLPVTVKDVFEVPVEVLALSGSVRLSPTRHAELASWWSATPTRSAIRAPCANDGQPWPPMPSGTSDNETPGPKSQPSFKMEADEPILEDRPTICDQCGGTRI